MRSPSPRQHPKTSLFKTLIGITIAIAFPIGVVAVANLPYPLIRRPVAKTAPILLLPSYISFDKNYRAAIASVAQAEQLIGRVTSPGDLNIGKAKLTQAQQHLDALPLDFLRDYPTYNSGWYRWQFSALEFDRYRAKIAQLEAVVFQEENAETFLQNLQNALDTAKREYKQTNTPQAKEAALSAWRASLTELGQVPPQTLAGRNARQILSSEQDQFRETIGESASQDRATVIIDSAKQYAWQAAIASQNPPHAAVKWQQIETLWQQAINELDGVSANDGAVYRQAQTLRAQYTNNLGQAKIRRQLEQDSVDALNRAQKQIETLLATTATDPAQINYPRTAAQLQSIINTLESVQANTTVHAKAAELRQFARTKLQEIQAASP
jgi:hypothetical protein